MKKTAYLSPEAILLYPDNQDLLTVAGSVIGPEGEGFWPTGQDI